MALNDDATLVIGSGNFFTALPGTVFPTDLLVPGAAWENVGNTSLEDIFSSSSEGGDETVLGTLQRKTLRTSKAPRSEVFNFIVQQFDKPSLKLYYGSNAVELANGNIGPHQNPTPTTCAFLVVFVDGVNTFAFYAPKAEVYRSDDPDFSNTESLAGLPLGVRPVVTGTNQHAFEITPLGSVKVPTVTAALPASAAAGATVTLTGTGFTGATGVKFGATAATSFSVVSGQSITAVVPAGTAGSAPVTVTTPAGVSVAYAYTRGA